MNHRLVAAIGRATKAVRANNLMEGMRLIQDALSQREPRSRSVVQACTRSADDSINSSARLLDRRGGRSRQPGLSSMDASLTDIPPARQAPSQRQRTTAPRGARDLESGFIRRRVSRAARRQTVCPGAFLKGPSS